MSTLTIDWADGTYAFALKGKQIEELERVCGKIGFGAIYQRIMLGVWFYADLYHTIRLGLIGGGMGAVEAEAKCKMYVDGVPMVAGPNSPESVAKAILASVMIGFEDFPPGEQQAGT